MISNHLPKKHLPEDRLLKPFLPISLVSSLSHAGASMASP
jgi:hypothetical protein